MGEQKDSRGSDFWLPIGIGAVALVGVAIMIGISLPRTTSSPTSGGNPASVQPRMDPPPIQSPRAAADELFNRAMMAHETGQTLQAASYLPEAIAAYQTLEPLDSDGLFHLAMLQMAVGDEGAARATSDRILVTSPNHLLGLAAAAQASEKSEPNDAKQFWKRFLDAQGEQQGRLPEYAHHQRMFPMLIERANDFIASGPGEVARPMDSQ